MSRRNEPSRGYLLEDDVYRYFKSINLYVLPWMGVFLYAVSQLFGPIPLETLATIAGVYFLLGALNSVFLALSSRSYDRSEKKYDGDVIVAMTDEGKKIFHLALNSDPDDLPGKDHILFRVVLEKDQS